jgi:hypothetical protein
MRTLSAWNHICPVATNPHSKNKLVIHKSQAHHLYGSGVGTCNMQRQTRQCIQCNETSQLTNTTDSKPMCLYCYDEVCEAAAKGIFSSEQAIEVFKQKQLLRTTWETYIFALKCEVYRGLTSAPIIVEQEAQYFERAAEKLFKKTYGVTTMQEQQHILEGTIASLPAIQALPSEFHLRRDIRGIGDSILARCRAINEGKLKALHADSV